MTFFKEDKNWDKYMSLKSQIAILIDNRRSYHYF